MMKKMAELGFIRTFTATHGTRERRADTYRVEITLKGRIVDGFVAALDDGIPSGRLQEVVSSLEGTYLDDITGRATNENIGLFLLYELRDLPIASVTVYESERAFARVFPSDMVLDFPAQIAYSKAKSLLVRDQLERATDALDEAIRLNPAFAEAYNLRGRCWKYRERHDLALSDFLAANEIQPGFGEAYRNLGNAYYYLDKTDEMIPAFTRAIELMPSSALAFNNRGFAYQRLQELDLALKDHTQAIALDPKYAEAYLDRAATRHALGEHDLAEADEKTARALQETHQDTFAGVTRYC